MVRHPRKEKTAMAVAVLASLAFIFAAVFVYDVPGATVTRYVLIMLILLAGIMAVAAVLVGLLALFRRLFKR